MRGRKPVPTHLKIIRGNPGKRPLNHHEPESAATLPPCPAHLSADAKKEWKRVGKMLTEHGVMTELDTDALALYCSTYALWKDADGRVTKMGIYYKQRSTGLIVQNPWFKPSMKLAERLQKLFVEFGITPSSRTRIKIAKKEQDDEDLKTFGI